MKNKYIKLIFLWLLVLPMTYSVFAQQQVLTGSVTDEAGKPVRDAVISIKEVDGLVTYSDSTGNFTIKGQIGQYIEITSGNRHKIVRVDATPVALKISDNDELINIGFGMTRDKEELTSAIGVVRSDELSKSYSINPANALYGKLPGLTVLQNGGVSWDNNPDIYIRGVGTLNTSLNNPSIVVLIDGFERPLSSLSLYEIESVSILKDAAATALYGLRGANGILMVTTKRADAQKNNIEVNYESGITRVNRWPKFLEGYDYANRVNEALGYDGLDPIYSASTLNAFKSGSSPFLYPNVNWINESFRDLGYVNNLNLVFQRSARNVNYYTLLNLQTDQGLLGPVDENEGYSTQLSYTKFNFRTNVDIAVTPTTKFFINLAGNLRETQIPGVAMNDIMSAVFNTPSAAYPIKTTGSQWAKWGGTSYYANNPVALISATGYQFSHTRELLADFTLKQKLDVILPGLSIEGALAYDNSALYNEGKTKQFQYEALSAGEGGEILRTLYGKDTELSYYSNLGNQWSESAIRGKLNYLNYMGNNTLSATLLYEQNNLIKTGRSQVFRHRMVGGNIHFAGITKYFADLSLAYSGTNLLDKGSRYGLFPAVSLAWKLSNEDWFPRDLFDNFKVRASWGMTGSDLGIPQNLSAKQYVSGTGYYFLAANTGQGGLREGRLPSTGATFETSAKTNIGVDISMFGMLDLTADVFYDHRTNILISTENSLSGVVGVEKPYRSAGIVNNKGVEIGLCLHDNIGDFTYEINGQFSFVRNKIIEMGEQYRPYDYLKRTGRSVNQAFGLEVDGFFISPYQIGVEPTQLFSEVRPGDIKYKNQNKDFIIDEYDEVAIGYSTLIPEIYYSGAIDLGYKGFGLNALFQGVANSSVYLNTPSIFWPLTGNTSISDYSDDRWTTATQETATLPRLTTLENANNYRSNSIWITDGSYLKLRSLEIYYDLPSFSIARLNVSNTRVFIRGRDLFSIDKIKVVDPEAIGIVYPICSTYSIGINIGF